MERLEFRTDLPEPVLSDATDVRVRVHAAALNHLDLFVLGGLPGVTITPPWILGADAAGVVDRLARTCAASRWAISCSSTRA